MTMTDFNLLPLLPEIFMAITAMGLLIVGVIRGNESTGVISSAVIVAMGLALMFSLGINHETRTVLGGMFIFDSFAAMMKALILIGLIASVGLSIKYLEQEDISRFEYPVLVMLSGIGMMIMVSSHNMLSLYMGLELQSLSLYVLASFHRNSVRSAEAGIKYFILGALSSGMLLFGISMIYGATGALDFGVIGQSISMFAEIPLGVIFGLVFVLAGLAFKISAVPFHMWTPDVYEGAPTSVTALFAIVPKVAAMGLLIRLLYEPFAGAVHEWSQILYFLSLSSMILGAFAAIAQTSLKRLLAYSSIGHMGYALIGLVVGTQEGASAVVLYMMIYMVMSAGVFAIVLCLRRDGFLLDKIEDMRGLSVTNPALAYAMAILMFSMSGIPPMAGFFGKLVIFQAAVAQEFYVLAVLGVLSSVIAAYYYLRIIKVMFFEDPSESLDNDMPMARKVVLMISLIFVLGFIVKPSAVVDSTRSAVSSLFKG